MMMMNDGDVDIRVLALRRQQQRRRQSSIVLQENNAEVATPYSSRVSSAYETTPVKTYASSASSSPARRSSYVGGIDEEARIGRMHVPPVIKCQCNGMESYALISTSETVSTISMDFVKKLRLMDQIHPEISPVFNPLSLHQPELMGKVKYIDLAIGNNWQQVAQFNIIEAYLTDITLGIDFLRRTQAFSVRYLPFASMPSTRHWLLFLCLAALSSLSVTQPIEGAPTGKPLQLQVTPLVGKLSSLDSDTVQRRCSYFRNKGESEQGEVRPLCETTQEPFRPPVYPEFDSGKVYMRCTLFGCGPPPPPPPTLAAISARCGSGERFDRRSRSCRRLSGKWWMSLR